MRWNGCVRAAVLSAVLSAAAATGWAGGMGKVEVAASKGECRMTREGNQVKLQAGERVKAGDEIRTGSTGEADIAWGGWWGCRVMRESVASVVSTDPVNQRFALTQGSAFFNFKTLPAGAEFRLETPAAVAAVRGTRFSAKILQDKGFGPGTTIAVKQGLVEVENPGGEPLYLASGQAADIYPKRRTDVRELSEQEEEALAACDALPVGAEAKIDPA